MLSLIKSNKAIRSVLLLVGGSGLGHIITFTILPVLTRYFTPTDFGYLAVYIALISLMSSVACLRFEIAIPLPKVKKVALALLVMSGGLCFILALITVPILMFFSEKVGEMTGLSEGFLFLIPLGVFLAGFFNSLQYWFTRCKSFGLIARTRITQSVAGNSTQLGAGFLGLSSGLALGHLFYCSAGVLGMVVKLLRSEFNTLKKLKQKHFIFSMKKYKQYPLFSTPEVFANNAGIQFPILLISAYSVSEEAGLLLLAMKVMQAPMGLIGSSISQVFYAEVAKANNSIEQKNITKKTLKALFKVGIGPIIFVGIIAEPVFLFIFGPEWGRAGTLVSWCTLWFAFQFASSPISMIMHVKQRQKSMLLLTTFGGLLRVIPVIIFAFYFNVYVVEVYAITGALFYLLCLVVFSNVAGFGLKELLSIFLSNIKFILLWLVLGVVCLALLRFGGL